MIRCKRVGTEESKRVSSMCHDCMSEKAVNNILEGLFSPVSLGVQGIHLLPRTSPSVAGAGRRQA